MESDDSYHSESELYYPDEMIEETDKENKEENKQTFSMKDVQNFIDGQKPENTIKKTRSDMNAWIKLLKSLEEQRNIEEIPAEELNILICHFFMEVRKNDGGPYEPSTLTSFQRSLQRYLDDKGSKLNILKDQEFTKSRQVLLAKKKQLVEKRAKGNRPRAAQELCEEEEDLLFTSGEFGDGNPEALRRTVWWLLSGEISVSLRMEPLEMKSLFRPAERLKNPSWRWLTSVQSISSSYK